MSRGGTSPIPWKRRRRREIQLQPCPLSLMSNVAVGCFILDAKGEPEICQDVRAWGEWMQTAKRHLHDETVGGHRVSTVFLGLDHGFGGQTQLWETCVFGGFLHGEISRYSTREEASDGHHKMCAEVRESMQ